MNGRGTVFPAVAASGSISTGDTFMARQHKKTEDEDGVKNISRNRRATHNYEIVEQLECGIVLVGTEVKSLRENPCNLEEAYAKLEDGEVWLIGTDIPEYSKGNRLNHKTRRPRKLLMHRREIEKFAGKATQQGFTLVPLRMYFKNGRAKVELAIAKGKAKHDKRESLKKADAQKEIRRAMSNKRR
jgi:SsrA-binding protein